MKNKSLGLGIASILTLLLMAGCGSTTTSGLGGGAVQGNATIFGDFSKTNSGGITISLIGTRITTVTAASGDFALNNIPQGTYTLSATSLPYQPKFRNNITVTGNGVYTVDPFSVKVGKFLDSDLYNLYSPFLAVASFELHPEASIGPDNVTIRLTADNKTIVFEGPDQSLYAQPADGSAQPLLIDTNAGPFMTTPDSSTVVYWKNSSLYSSPVSISAPALLDTGVSTNFQITPDSSTVVYMKGTSLYSSPVSTSAPVLLDTTVYTFQIAPDSKTVVYMKGTSLYSSPVSTSAPALLDTNVSTFQIVPDSSRVVYTNSSYDLSSTTISTSAPVLLDTNVYTFQITPDSSRVVYTNLSYDLSSTTISTSAPVLLDTNAGNFKITPDSQTVVYMTSVSPYQLKSTASGSSSPVLLDTGVVNNFQITPDSSRVVYVNTGNELSSTTINVSAPVLLAINVHAFQITPDSAHAVYMSTNENIGYFRTVDGNQPAHAIDNYMTIPVLSSDGRFFVYFRSTPYYPDSLDNGILRVDFPAGW